MATPPYSLCYTCPKPYLQFTKFLLNLKFDEDPNYARHISLFQWIIHENPYVWRVHIDFTHEVPCKRVRLNDDEPLKKIQMGLKVPQWISVYDGHPPLKQRFFSNLADADLSSHFQMEHVKGPYVTSVAYNPDSKSWVLIMDDRAGYTAQRIYGFSHRSLPEEWIRDYWSKNYHITAVAGADDGIFLVAMSKGTQSVRQSYRVAKKFPFNWIKKQWAEGFHVTTMATSRRQWAVVSSKGTGFTNQAIELDFQYPEEGIHERSKQGYYITLVAATPDEVAVILSIPGVPATASVEQEMLLTFGFPVDGEAFKELLYFSLCYGRTTAVQPRISWGAARPLCMLFLPSIANFIGSNFNKSLPLMP